MSKRKSILFKTLMMVSLVLLLVAVIYFALKSFMPGLIPILRDGSEAEIEEFIRSAGSLQSVLITFFLQFLQVVSILFPGMPIQIAAGIIFGAFKGYLICHIAFITANIAVFCSYRKLKGRLSKWFSGDEDTAKFKFITESEYPEYMVVLASMMPFLPNGIIPYVAARTKITLGRFSAAVAIGSLPNILLFCAIGNRILKGDFLFSGVLFGATIIFIALMYVFRNKIIDFIKKFGSRPGRSRQ